MDGSDFEALVRIFGLTDARRDVIKAAGAGIVAALLSAVGVRPGGAALRENGERCRRGNQCRSGLCKERRGKGKCRQAPFQGICSIDQNRCSAAGSISCGPGCTCYVTLDGQSFCGKNATECGCGANNDCANRGGGAVCVRQTAGCCTFAGNTTCAFPCQDPDEG